MADLDKSLKIYIDILTRELGPEKAQDIINKAKAAVGDASAENISALQAAAPVTKKLGEETEDAAKKMRIFHGEGREMHRVIGELTRISPQLGEVFRAALNPIGGSIAIAIGLFVALKRHIEDVNKELDEEAARAFESFGDALEHQVTAADDASKALANYKTNLKHAGEELDPLGKKIKDETALYNEQVDAIKKVIEALGKKEESEVRMRGGSPEEIEAIRQQTQKSLADLDDRKGKHTAQVLQNELNQRVRDQMILDQAAQAAIRDQAKAKEKADNQSAERTKLIEQLKSDSPAQKKIDATANALEAAKKSAVEKPGEFGGEDPQVVASVREQRRKALDNAQSNYDAAVAARDSLKKRLDQLNNERQTTEDAVAEAEKNSSITQSRSNKNQEQINRLPGAIGAANTSNAIDASGNIIRDATAISKRGPQSDDEQKFVQRAAELASGQQMNLKNAEQYLQQLEKHPEAMEAVFNRLMNYNARVLGQLVAMGQRVSDLESQIQKK